MEIPVQAVLDTVPQCKAIVAMSQGQQAVQLTTNTHHLKQIIIVCSKDRQQHMDSNHKPIIHINRVHRTKELLLFILNIHLAHPMQVVQSIRTVKGRSHQRKH